jgi:hypothetical protein
VCLCTLFILVFKERRETGERKSERGELLEGIKLSRDSSMSVQRLTIIIYYQTCAVCSFKGFLLINTQCALALDVSPPPPIPPGLSGGSSLFLSVGVLGV